MQRKLIQSGTNLLHYTGINITEESNHTNVWRFIVSFSLFVWADISAFMVSITNTHDFDTFVTPIPYIAGAIIIQSGIFFMYYRRKIIGSIFYHMDRNIYIYPDEDLIPVKYPWYLEEKNITLLMTLAKYSSFGILAFINVPILGEIMFLGRIKTMPFPMWIPWTMGSLREELLAFLFQLVQGFCGLWLNYIVNIFLLIIIIEFLRQYRRLISAIKSLELRSLQGALDEKCFDRTLRENLIHCIRHHRILISNFQLFEIWFSMFFSIELAISGVTFTFALYIVMNAPSLAKIFNYFLVSIFIWMNFLIRCLISEIFSNLNNDLANAILWRTPWYRADHGNKKLLVMFHLLACQPLRLFGLSIFEATRVTFSKIIRMAYSFFNVLNRKKQ